MAKLSGESEKAYAMKMARKFRNLIGESELYQAEGIKFSVEELSELRIVDKKFKAMLKDYDDGKRSGYVFDLGKSPKWVNNIPLSNKRIDLTPNIIGKAVEKHNIPLKNLENLVYEIQNPIMAFPSISENVPEGTQNIVVVTNIKNADGFPVVCAIRLDVESYKIRVDRITSIQRKDDILSFLERSIEESDKKDNYINGKRFLFVNKQKTIEWLDARGLQSPKLYNLLQLSNNNVSQKPSFVNTNSMQDSSKIMYINPNKKETEDWMARTGVQFPFLPSSDGLINKITYKYDIVNTNSMQDTKKYSITKDSDTSVSQKIEKPEAQKRTMLIPQNKDVSKIEDIRHKASQKIFKEFSIPVNQRTDLKSLINAALKKVEQGNSPSEVITSSLFNLLEKNSKVVDDSVYNQYKDLKELIRTTKLHFSERVIGFVKIFK